MAYPIWSTNPDLGIVVSGSTAIFNVSALTSVDDPTSLTLLSNTVPSTVAIAGASATVTMSGAAVEKDSDYRITLRASNSAGITDRSFTLRIQAAPAIQWSQSGTIAVWPAGTQRRISLAATWGWPLEYVLVSGSMPRGVFLDSTGVIYGVAGSNLQAISLDSSTWNISGGVDNTDIGAYTFTVRVRDAATKTQFLDRTLTINTVNAETLISSSSLYTADSSLILASASNYTPVVILESFDAVKETYLLGEYRHSNEFIRQISHWNPQGETLEFRLLSGENAYDSMGYDSNTTLGYDGFDNTTVDFLSIEPATGFLYGTLPIINANRQQHQISVLLIADSVYSQVYSFEMIILGEYGINFEFLDDDGGVISPNTVYELTISQGEISDLGVQARWIEAPPSQLLFYELASGQLPAGITLSPNGLLMGQVGWSAPLGAYDFAVRVYDPSLDQSVISPKFSQIQNYRLIVTPYLSGVTVVDRAYDAYYRAYLAEDQRILWQNLITDPRIFGNSVVYRAEDENYGRRLDCEFLAFTGIQEHEASEFAGAVGKNWALKRFRFGSVKSAIMRDDQQRYVCDVIYADIIDPQLNSEGRGPHVITRLRSTNLTGSVTADSIMITVDDSSLTADSTQMRNIYPATLENQLARLREGPGQITDSVLPKWMKTPQQDGRPLGQIPAAILCFVAAGRGEEILRKIRNSPHSLNQIDFHVDRMVLRRAPNTLFDTTIDDGNTTFDLDGTTFDLAILRDKYIYFRTDGAIYGINN